MKEYKAQDGEALEESVCLPVEDPEDVTKSTSCSKKLYMRIKSPPSDPQDGLWSWLVCFCGLVCNTIVFGWSYTFGLLYPLLLREFGEGKAKTAFVGSLVMALEMVLTPLAARLYDRFGARKVIILGALLCVVGLACSAPVSSLSILFFTYSVVAGFGACCVQTSVFMIVPRYFKKKAASALGCLAVGVGSGILVFSGIVGECLETIGLRRTFLVLAGICSALCFIAVIFNPNIDRHSSGRQEYVQGAGKEDLIVYEDYPKIWRNHALLIFAALTMLEEFGAMIVLVHLANHIQSVGITAKESNTLYQALGLASMVARVTCGFLIDRVPVITPLRAYRVAILLIGISFLLIPISVSYSVLMVLIVCYGLFHGSCITAMYAYQFSIVPPRQRSQAFGIVMFGMGIGIGCGPPFAGILVDHLQSYPPAFYLAGGIELLLLISSFLLEIFKPVTSSEKAIQQSCMEAYHDLLVVEKVTVL